MAATSNILISISTREKEILQLVSTGLSSSEIARILHLSSHTIRDHRKSLKRKLQVSNVAQLIRRGFELQLLNTSTSKS
jgi:DNA-binding CsgD family transcriptional regulator